MKVYFEDGCLVDNPNIPEEDYKALHVHTCDAQEGVSFCNVVCSYCASNYPNDTLYTNSICGLNPKYSWKDESKRLELYMRNEAGKWVEASSLLKDGKRLDASSDVIGMYLRGDFSGR